MDSAIGSEASRNVHVGSPEKSQRPVNGQSKPVKGGQGCWPIQCDAVHSSYGAPAGADPVWLRCTEACVHPVGSCTSPLSRRRVGASVASSGGFRRPNFTGRLSSSW
ncbi:hypothetical protein V6N13_122684 [Hibiscus sabdariffa]